MIKIISMEEKEKNWRLARPEDRTKNPCYFCIWHWKNNKINNTVNRCDHPFCLYVFAHIHFGCHEGRKKVSTEEPWYGVKNEVSSLQ